MSPASLFLRLETVAQTSSRRFLPCAPTRGVWLLGNYSVRHLSLFPASWVPCASSSLFESIEALSCVTLSSSLFLSSCYWSFFTTGGYTHGKQPLLSCCTLCTSSLW